MSMLKDELIVEVAPILKSAGQIILRYYQKKHHIAIKPGGSIVTQADTEAESFLIDQLSLIIPGASFFAEESGQTGGDNGYCWVIDPLDGTTNFAHGIPHFCISVGLTYNNVPIFGAIYQPILHDLFYAQNAYGAFVNGSPMHLSTTDHIKRNLILMSTPAKKSSESLQKVLTMLRQNGHTYAFRQLGSSALDIAYVASGRADLVFFEGLSWWDVAAGLVLLEQVGGVVTTFTGDPIDRTYQNFIAARPDLHPSVLQFFS